MRDILTAADVKAYASRGMKKITLAEMPVLTEVAREELKRLGMGITVSGQAGGTSPQTSGTGSALDTKNDTAASGKSITAAASGKRPFQEVIRSGQKITGMFVGTPHPVMTEFLGRLGFDFLTIDAEHNAMHLETVQKMRQGLAATPTYGMVRVPTISYDAISGALDIGADAILIPQIRTAGDIERIREYALYPPNGRRGSGPSRAWDFGSTIMEMARNADRKTNVIVQIETVSALNNLDAILDNDFVDMYFIGPGDLSMDMGIFGQFSNPKLMEAIMMVREKTWAAGKRLGIFAGSFDSAADFYQKGFDMTIVNSDLGNLGNYITKELSKVQFVKGNAF